MTAFCPHCGYDLRLNAPIERDGLLLAPREHSAWWRGRAVDLRPSTFEALHSLVKAEGAAVSQEVLAERIGSNGYHVGAGIAIRIAEIRRKLPGAPVITVRGCGYAWRPKEAC